MGRCMWLGCMHVSAMGQAIPLFFFCYHYYYYYYYYVIADVADDANSITYTHTHTLMTTRCRHCTHIGLGLDTYASVLVVGDKKGGLVNTIESMEKRIIPCVTAICPECGMVSLLSNGTSESCLRTVVMWRRLAEWVDC
jgi:hypothetical protein